MKYYTLVSNDGDTRVVVETPRGMAYDLTSVEPELADMADLVQAGFLSGVATDDIATRLLSNGDADSFDLAEVIAGTRDGSAFYRMDRPFEPPEVWAAGSWASGVLKLSDSVRISVKGKCPLGSLPS